MGLSEFVDKHQNDTKLFEGYRVSAGRLIKGNGVLFNESVGGAVAEFEHGANIGSRVTLTRVAVVGIFALGLKKDRNKIYIAIELANGKQVLIESKAKNEKGARDFVSKFNRAAAQFAPTVEPPVELPSAPTPDAIDQLKRLGELHAAGVLTDAEFAAKKADLLNRM